MEKLKITVIILLLTIVLGCKKDKEMIEKFESFDWLAKTSGDVTCPVKVVFGKFIMSDGSTGFIPSGEYLNDTWGWSGSTMSVGEDRKKIPDSLKIIWFSYTENKFFEETFKLPQKKIYDIFKKDYGKSKYPSGEEYKNEFTNITLGFAPQGLVTLWASGFGVIEIGTYQAKEVFIEWSSYSKNPNRNEAVKDYQKDMLPFVQDEILKGKISNIYFKNRLERFHYTIGTNKKDFEIVNYDIEFVNREVISKENTGLEFLTDTTNGKAVAKGMTLFIKGPFYKNLEVRIWIGLLEGKKVGENLEPLQEREYYEQLRNRFKTFFEQNKDVQLYIKFDDKIVKSNIKNPVYCGKVFLKSPTSEMEIPNSKVEVYDEEKL
ncbi:DUF2931 family protein [Flavobacterium psychrophilum]|nr:DUF2931 family protein [Flavobacterium psychrophilum]